MQMPPQSSVVSSKSSSAQQTGADNPWYILATIYDEPADEEVVYEKNLRFWNGWSCSELSIDKRKKLAGTLKLDIECLSPWNDEEKTFVGEKFAKRGIYVPDCRCAVDFSNLQFTTRCRMEKFVFPGRAEFGKAIFFDDAWFSDAVFLSHSSFVDVEFRAEAAFDRSSGEMDFSRAIFKGIAKFSACEGGCFRDSTFEYLADFSSSTTQGDFFDSSFLGPANFSESIFLKGADFSFADFAEVVSFSKTIFEESVNFSYCRFSNPVIFRDARFSKYFPELIGTILHPNTTFTAKDEFWPETDDAPAEESRESLAIIRHAVGKQGLPEEEHYFYRREMAFAARIGTPLQRLPYQAFGALSDFGYSLAKPTLWLAAVWFVGLLAYAYWLTWLAPALADAHPIFTAAGFSVAQLFGFLGFTGSYFRADFLDALPTALKVLAGFQTVAGVVLLFFLGLGLRNRFRLK